MEREISELRSVTVPASAGASAAGLRLTYREAGASAGPALVLLHGIGSNSSGFNHQLIGLGDRFRVLAWNAPGYGGSSHFRAEAPTPADYADALLALLNERSILRCHLVGTSLGAIVAAAFAASQSDRVLTLTLSSPAIGNARLEAGERAAKLKARLDDIEQSDSGERAERRARLLVAPGTREEVLAAAREQIAALDSRGYAQAARMLSEADIFAYAASIQAPTLILAGSEDRITLPDICAQPIHAAMTKSKIDIFDGVGHLIHLERPEIFNSRLRDFVEQNPTDG